MRNIIKIIKPEARYYYNNEYENHKDREGDSVI